MSNDRRKQLDEIFKDVDKSKRLLLDDLLDEVCFMEDQMRELRKLPHIRIHPKDPTRQKLTPAGRQYKICLQSYKDAIRILVGVLNKIESGEQDALLAVLKEFSVDTS